MTTTASTRVPTQLTPITWHKLEAPLNPLHQVCRADPCTLVDEKLEFFSLRQKKRLECKESDEHVEKVVAVKGGVVTEVTVPSMKFKGLNSTHAFPCDDEHRQPPVPVGR